MWSQGGGQQPYGKGPEHTNVVCSKKKTEPGSASCSFAQGKLLGENLTTHLELMRFNQAFGAHQMKRKYWCPAQARYSALPDKPHPPQKCDVLLIG